MEKKKMSLQIVNPKAAGIDIGSRMHIVAVDQYTKNVRTFGVYIRVSGGRILSSRVKRLLLLQERLRLSLGI
jgi:hypothetical protein